MILTKKDFEVGQIVACKHSGNYARNNKGYTLGKVTKAGNKIITVTVGESGNYSVQFLLDDRTERDYLLQKSNYVGDYELFPSEQAYLDYEEKKRKLSEIETIIFPRYSESKLSIEQIRKIYDIVNE